MPEPEAKTSPTPERRSAPRTPARELPHALACRITPGRAVRALDVSATGMLVESTSPLFPGRTVKLHLQSEARGVKLHGKVVRGVLAAVDPERGALFVSAIAFDRRFDLAHELFE